MPYNDLRTLLVQSTNQAGESLYFHQKPTTPIDCVRARENASELARRMGGCETDSQKPVCGRLPGTTKHRQPPPPMGEIVEVEGGHIVRSTGRKDRHSKVYTAKGPRDRRVRLSASTAIQFYDLQDRLGYDRPSKAVAWLIEKAKASIDELARLPQARPPIMKPRQKEQIEENEAQSAAANANVNVRTDHARAIARERARERAKERSRTQERDAVAKAALLVDNSNNNNDTAQQSFPNLFSTANINTTNSLVQALQLQNAASKGFTAGQRAFHSPPAQMDMSSDSISRSLHLQATQLQQQKLFQSLLAHTTQAVQNFSTPLPSQLDAPAAVFTAADNSSIMTSNQQSMFSSSAASAFQVPFVRDICMSEQQQQHEFGGQQPRRILSTPWNNNSSNNNNAVPDFGAFGSSALNMRGNNHQSSYPFRGTLQSSSSPVRARPMPLAQDHAAAAHQFLQTTTSTSGSGFSSFRIPARIQGIDEHDDVKPSAASSNSQI